MKAVDLRLIFDEEGQQIVIGCHGCEKTTSAPIRDIPASAVLTPEFAVEHLQTCGKTIK